jgi:UDP-N-acetylglucosamine--N-acetylmuramyl-(pentapeptide) pyrophosphoryl-undecaprenol N-acetylglucosamine transferase
MDYVRTQTKSKDGKLLAVGHSMGGILLYALLSRCGFKGMDSGLAGVTTLASTFDYSSSGTLLKYLLPMKEPAQAINLPIMPIDTMLAMAHPLMCRPPYSLSWLTANISAPQMMDPEVIEKLVLNSLCKYKLLNIVSTFCTYLILGITITFALELKQAQYQSSFSCS